MTKGLILQMVEVNGKKKFKAIVRDGLEMRHYKLKPKSVKRIVKTIARFGVKSVWRKANIIWIRSKVI